jgi:putative Mn2+ efflux pump MntP
MSFGALLALAVGLAMDATAVAAARGLAAPRARIGHAVRVGLMFGGAQALMPLLGWIIGARLGALAARWDHWIAFVLLSGIGAKMLWEARQARDAGPEGPRPDAGEVFGVRVLLVLALATSIDAFAVGITLPMLGVRLLPALLTIGLTTALLSGAAVLLSRRLGAALGPRLDAVGGLVLIALGAKILIQHLGGG